MAKTLSTAPTMLTTTDNPFNPFTDWDSWYAWDKQTGYNTPEYLARIVKTSYALSEADQDQAIDDAIDDIIRLNPSGIYKRISANE